MALSAFDDPAAPPGAPALTLCLGAAAPLWTGLLSHMGTSHPPVTEVWSFSGAKFGWSLRVKQKERVLLYLTPQAGRFVVGVVLGEKAVAAAHESDLPATVLAVLDAAPRYAEGRGIRLTIGPGDDLASVERLVALKVTRFPAAPTGTTEGRTRERSPRTPRAR